MSSRIIENKLLYRRIRGNKHVSNKNDHHYIINDDGSITIRYIAFKDTNMRPSTDIAEKRKFNAEKTKNGDLIEYRESNGVIGIESGSVSSIEPKPEFGNREVYVDRKPSSKNKSHALICVNPEFIDKINPLTKTKITSKQRKKQFKKFTIILADLATEYLEKNGWIIEPVHE